MATAAGLMLLLLVGAAFALGDQLMATTRAEALTQTKEREKLARRIEEMQSTVAELKAQTPPDAAAMDSLRLALSQTQESIAALGERIVVIEKKIDEKKLDPSFAPLNFAPPGVAPTPAPNAAAQALTAFTDLKLAAISGKPFARELAAWVKLHPTPDDNLRVLSDVATHGIISEAELSRQLLALLDAIVPQVPVAEDTSTLGKINSHLKGLVHIKKTVSDPYATLRKAALHEDVEIMTRDAEALSDNERAPLEPWLKLAHAHIAALDALSTLTPNAGY